MGVGLEYHMDEKICADFKLYMCFIIHNLRGLWMVDHYCKAIFTELLRHLVYFSVDNWYMFFVDWSLL